MNIVTLKIKLFLLDKNCIFCSGILQFVVGLFLKNTILCGKILFLMQNTMFCSKILCFVVKYYIT